MSSIPGFRFYNPRPPAAPAAAGREELKASLLFGAADIAALRKAPAIVENQIGAIPDAWCGFVVGNPRLPRYFSDPAASAATGAAMRPSRAILRSRPSVTDGDF